MESKTISKVEVNQRELINKILSRHSAEFSVFRELLQNAEDAHASCVGIAITDAGVCVRNNGKVFEEEDWKRLSCLAIANPNEEALALFGVGFYSIFSISDSPTVSSGNTSMKFFFERDALYTETTVLPAYQEHTQIECKFKPGVGGWDVARLAEFLESSIYFARNISEISLSVNESFKCEITRETNGANALGSLVSGINPLFDMQPALIHNLRVTTKENNSIRKTDFTEVSSTVSLTDSRFGLLLAQILGKSMPLNVPLRYPINSESGQLTGKIYIVFATAQTTGASFHVGSRFIPTAERDAIDLHSPVISAWNRALVGCAGSLARAFCDYCLKQCRAEEQGLYLSLHQFKDSAPHTAVSQALIQGLSFPSMVQPHDLSEIGVPENSDEYYDGNENEYSSDEDERRMLRRYRRHAEESEGSDPDSQLGSESNGDEHSYDSSFDTTSEPAEDWNDGKVVDKDEYLLNPMPQGQLYNPETYSRDPLSSYSHVPLAWPPAISGTSRHSTSNSRRANPASYSKSDFPTTPPVASASDPTTNHFGPPPAGTKEESYASLQQKYFKVLEDLEHFQSHAKVLTTQRDKARKQLAETAAFLQDKQVLIPELHVKLNSLKQQLHALGLAHPQLQQLFDPVAISVNLSSPHVPLPTPPKPAKTASYQNSRSPNKPPRAYTQSRAQQIQFQAHPPQQQLSQQSSQTQYVQVPSQAQLQTHQTHPQTNSQTPQTQPHMQFQAQSPQTHQRQTTTHRSRQRKPSRPQFQNQAILQHHQSNLQTQAQFQLQALQAQLQAQAQSQLQAQLQAQIIQAQLVQQLMRPSIPLQPPTSHSSERRGRNQKTSHAKLPHHQQHLQSSPQTFTPPFFHQSASPLPLPTPPPVLQIQKRDPTYNRRTHVKQNQQRMQAMTLSPQLSSPQTLSPQIPSPQTAIQSPSLIHPQSNIQSPYRRPHTQNHRPLWQPT